MKMILWSMAAVSAIAVAVPAVAQQPGGQYQNRGYSGQDSQGAYARGNFAERVEQLRARIQSGVASGEISRREAQPLRARLRQLRDLEIQYSRNGLSREEGGELHRRLRDLRRDVAAADGGGRGRYDQYDRDNYGLSQNERFDRDNDGWDDRDRDRDGRWEDDVNDGRYEQPVQRGGVGGLIDSVLGTGGLRVGQQAPGDLGGIPYEYRSRYRDGSGVYYRSDGRSIYEIDARSRSVLRVYPMDR